MSHSILKTILGAAVADAAAFTLSYPLGKNKGSFYGSTQHVMSVNNQFFDYPDDFDVTLTSNTVITITNKTGAALPAGATVQVQLEEQGGREYRDQITRQLLHSTTKGGEFLINLGAPGTADADGICASQSGTADTAMTIAGALASGGAVTFDVPRNVVAAWTGTAVLTVTGTDVYGSAMVESSASGTSLAGKKAFKTVTSVVPSANITVATVGSGDVLGLPVFLPGTGFVVKELENGAAPTAGTVVAGVLTAGGSVATSGDVRGTYDPNSAADGSKVFQLVVFLPDPGYIGQAQYAG
jgi:hypothetical protein